MKKISTKSNNDSHILNKLYQVVQERKRNPQSDSYVALLLQKGRDTIHAKVTEEADELIDASHRGLKKDIIHEMSDLWFHCMVLLGFWDIEPAAIYQELSKRWGRSGLKAKANGRQSK